MTARSRYTMVCASFWLADRATRGLSPLAACLYLRAESESLIGVMAHSPRVLAATHRGTTVEDVAAAVDELASRGLARWWPDLDTLAILDTAAKARGRAVVAAKREIAALPPEVRDYVLGYLRAHPMGDLDGGWPSLLEHSQEHSQEQQHEQVATPLPSVASLPLRLTPPPSSPSQPALLPGVEPDSRAWRRRQARNLWDWHEAERIRSVHGGPGQIRQPLDEHLAMILRLVAKVATVEGVDERKAFELVRDFRVRALAQATAVRDAGTEPTFAAKLVKWARSDAAWSIKAYEALRAEHDPGSEPSYTDLCEAHKPTRAELKVADRVFDETGSWRAAFDEVLRERARVTG